MQRGWLLFPIVAAALLAAHFFRAGDLLLVSAAIIVMALLGVPRPWAARAVQAALVIGAVEWLRTLAVFAAQRIALDQPYFRLTAILLAVAAFTAASAFVFRQPALRRRYRL